MALSPLVRTIPAVVVAAETDGATLRVRFAPTSGNPNEIEDRIPFTPPGALAAVNGIGRLLRILRAGRIQIPQDPYKLGTQPEKALGLVRRCCGTLVHLQVTRRLERILTVWTDAGVERIRGVVDYTEEPDGLMVRRRGGQSVLRIPRKTLIRFSPSSREYFKVLSVEAPPRFRLR